MVFTMETAEETKKDFSKIIYRRLFLSFLKYTFITLIILILSTSLAIAGYGAWDDYERSDEIAEGITIVGLDVGNMNIDDAYDLLYEKFESKYSQEIIFKVDDRSWSVNPAKFSFSLDYEKMLEEAYYAGYDQNIFKRIYRRFSNYEFNKNVELSFTYDRQAIQDYLEVLAYELNTEPEDAWIEVEGRTVSIHPEKVGLTLDVKASVDKVINQLLKEDRNIDLKIHETKPEYTVNDIDKIILIIRGERKLYLFQKESLVKVYPVAVGQPAYPTPYGDWSVVGKRRHPSWINPGSAWAKNMPPVIPPGPGNPLGTRKLELNAPAIRIHGTYSTGSIGRAASHGCIRMTIRDVEEIFEIVSVGTPVFIR